jgi:hypothetical protein
VTARPDAELVALFAEKVLELVPCDGWGRVNLGSAGGPVLIGDGCEHDRGKCYPRDTFQTIHGTVGGPPDALHDERHAFAGLRSHADWNWSIHKLGDSFVVAIFLGADRERLATSSDPDLCRAIVLASLRACGCDV